MTITRAATAWLTALILLTGCAGARPDPAGSSPAPATTAPATADAPASADAVDVVRGWLAALRRGDLDAARADLGSWSQRNADAQGGLDGMASGLAEGMAAFDSDGVTWEAVAVSGHDGAFVVTASGEVEREGITETAAHAWIVHPEDGRPVVEAFAMRPPEVLFPLPGAQLREDAPVEAFLPVGAVHAVVDGEVAASGVTFEGADGDQVRARVAPPYGVWAPGEHVVTVVSVPSGSGGDGPWAAVAVPFSTG